MTLFIAMMVACGPAGDHDTLCERFFEPYPDLISQRARTHLNATYLDAMLLYNQGDHQRAKDSLEKFLDVQRADLTGYIYLACCHLALGDADKAELQLDHLERSNILHYEDQIEWYRVVCWVCSGQLDRARSGAHRIIESGAHTYGAEARKLLDALQHHG